MGSVVSTMDPAKLIDVIPNVLEMLQLFKEVIDAVKDVSEGIGMMKNGAKPGPKRKDWYLALRYTDMLTQANAFKMLRNSLRKYRVVGRKTSCVVCVLNSSKPGKLETLSSRMNSQH